MDEGSAYCWVPYVSTPLCRTCIWAKGKMFSKTLKSRPWPQIFKPPKTLTCKIFRIQQKIAHNNASHFITRLAKFLICSLRNGFQMVSIESLTVVHIYLSHMFFMPLFITSLITQIHDTNSISMIYLQHYQGSGNCPRKATHLDYSLILIYRQTRFRFR